MHGSYNNTVDGARRRMGDEMSSIEISPEVLSGIGQRNRIQLFLHIYLATKHTRIFRQKAAREKDYAVAFFAPEQAEVVLSSDSNERSQIPEPNVEFFTWKEEAKNLLGTNPNSALAWRHSPKLELMY